MAQGRITADTVNALQPAEKDWFLWDDKLPGFGVKVTPAGAKVYILQYRMGGRGTKTKRYTIGKEGALRAQSARKLAEGLYGDVRNGTDIADAKRQSNEAKRAASELAFSPYVKEFCESTLKAKWPKSWQPTYDCLKLHASRHWRNKPLPDITAADVRQLLRRLDHQPATKRNLFAALSFLFNQSKRDGVIASSPLELVEAPPQVAERTRTLNDDELKWLWEAAQEEAQPYKGILEDLILLGQRRGEVAGLPWAELNRQRKEWHLPALRAKNGCENIIPLTARMVAKLDVLAGGDKWPRSGLVYPSREGTPPSGFSKLKRRLDAKVAKAAKEAGAEVGPWKLHDLRRTLATNMQRLGLSHETIEHLLNHREKSRTGIAKVYQTHDYKAEKLAALQRWEAELERIISGDAAVVVPFARKAKQERA
jgi:site-specific recombinase XerD